MRRSSSSSDGLFDGVLHRGHSAAEVSPHAWLRALLDAEAALVTACAERQVIPQAAADAIVAACRNADDFDAQDIGRRAAGDGNPVIALVRDIEQRVGADAAPFVHFGATSQDIMDTALVLVTTRAMQPTVTDLVGTAEAAAALAAQHRDTPMAGRTLLQQALPTTFGLKPPDGPSHSTSWPRASPMSVAPCPDNSAAR